MTAYYNEIDPKAAAWLRELIKQGHIAPGDVDERSIEDVRPDDLKPYTQCHFFAGIGIWSYALRLAGWPDDRPVWTGSCPCQPFSAAGKGNGFTDERHLWPAFHFLIEQRRPGTVFGEQVASRDGLAWLDLVHADMEATGYSFGAFDICAAGFGAPHIRQRLYFVADAERTTFRGEYRNVDSEKQRDSIESEIPRQQWDALNCMRTNGRLADTSSQQIDAADAGGLYAESSGDSIESRVVNGQQQGLERHGWDGDRGNQPGRISTGQNGSITEESATGSLGDTQCDGSSTKFKSGGEIEERGMFQPERPSSRDASRPTNGFWRDADWLFCRDGKWRPVSPGTFPLAHESPARVGRLRGYGNGIVATQAAEFIKACINHKRSAVTIEDLL